MKSFFIFVVFMSTVIPVQSQASIDSVKAAVNQLFTAMKNADGVMLKNSFTDSALLQTIVTNKEGKIIVMTESIAGFVDFINKEAPGNADERIVFESIKIDGPLAMAWTPYEFYYQAGFSHCGVNSFQLVKQAGVWKIQYIIDTRRKKACQ